MSDTHDDAGGAVGDTGRGEAGDAAEGVAHAPEQDAASAVEEAARVPEQDAASAVEGPSRDGSREGPEAALEGGELLLPLGNPPRWARGLLALIGGSLAAFVLMSTPTQLRWGVPLGALFILVATFGALDLLGSFDDPDDRVAHRVALRDLVPSLGLLTAGASSLFALVTLAVAGGLGVATSAVLVPASFLVTLVGVYRVGDGLGVWPQEPDGTGRTLLQRHGFWLVVITTLLYLPMLGSHSLSDPWETHYGEVSREILARNDWISLWWAQDGWFWSKPIFDFWMQALAMASFGVRYLPGQMLSAASEGLVPWPEWAVRLPVFLMTLLAGYLLYKAVARPFGRRAGLLGGIVLATMPQWFLLSHQTMTDMPFVAAMASAMALFLLGVHADPDREARVYEVSLGSIRLRFSAFHVVLGAVVACALPQVLYLLSRNLEIRFAPLHVRVMADSFLAGSPGNCGLPGNEACHAAAPVSRGLAPALQGLIWAQMLGVLLYVNWGERRVQRLFFLAAWFFAALSTMAKGPAGFGLPVLAALAYVLVTKRYRDLLRMEIAGGLLVLLAVAIPWFLAMYVRHGQPFTDRLLFHDMFKRAFTHVHDTNEGDDVSFRFYVWQLGYAMFPWTGLVPAGLLWWLRRNESERDLRTDASVFLAMWFLLAFSLFSLMLTKFHHYILPALPPAAMLTGVVLDDMLAGLRGAAKPRSGARLALYVASVGGGVAAALAGVSRAISAHAAKADTSAILLACALGVAGVALSVTGAVVFGGAQVDPARAPRSRAAVFQRGFEDRLLGAAGVAGAMLVFFVGCDLVEPFGDRPTQVRFWHLLTYNYKRPWPATVDFSGSLWAFVGGAALLTLLLFAGRIRRHAVTALVSLGVLFAGWGIDVYFVKTSPHWGQRETLMEYYRAARQDPGPIVGYQMNWKGENFYTGNHLPAFVTSGTKFTQWIDEQKKQGVKTFYFVTEHTRTRTLSTELGGPRFFDKLTTPALNNKFVLVRARFE